MHISWKLHQSLRSLTGSDVAILTVENVLPVQRFCVTHRALPHLRKPPGAKHRWALKAKNYLHRRCVSFIFEYVMFNFSTNIEFFLKK